MVSRSVIVLACCALAAPPPASAAEPCPDQDEPLAQAGAASFSAALVCAARAARPPGAALRVDANLSTAAQRHALDMVARRYFDHVSPNGGRLVDRLRRAGWIPRYVTWEAGEDIEWATGALATPENVLAGFMASPPHRRILLDTGYDQVGVGVAPGTPGHGADGVTVVLDFGHRAAR
jgi:uncharacterized protein YkwD